MRFPEAVHSHGCFPAFVTGQRQTFAIDCTFYNLTVPWASAVPARAAEFDSAALNLFLSGSRSLSNKC